MKRKNTGFTLIEMIIVVAVIIVVLGITTSIFITGNKVFSNSDVKSTLQIEGQAIQEKISDIGMQSSGIDSIKSTENESGNMNVSIDNNELADKKYNELESQLTDINGNETDKKWLSVGEVVMNYYDEDKINIISKEISIEYKKDADGNLIKTGVGTFTLLVGGKELSSNVKSIRIKPINIDNRNETFKDANSVLINIELEKKKGFSDVSYPISIQVKFRNSFKNNNS